ncbi:MAG: FtsX-like permease family protein [Verrucomicrobia bacterium]|nr:FtsX-like permease family protein [Cytophagales bacterium]
MNLLGISWKYLKNKPLNTLLSLLLTVFGVATITVLLLLSRQLEDKLLKDARGIDLVVGAKGSPIQLILCNIFHIDNPTGNIKLSEATALMRNRMVKKAIPVSLGDNYEGYRIVGTSPDYLALYKTEIATGKPHNKVMEVTLGAEVARRTGLKINDSFAGSHGLSGSEDVHENAKYKVTCVLKPSGSVADRLIITNLESVWEVHDGHSMGNMPDTSQQLNKEITALLVQYRSPMAAINLPRFINSQTNMQAASPAYETVKLLKNIGVGIDALQIFGYLVMGMASLSVFISLFNALKERRYDLAVMRMLGASQTKIFVLIILEGLLIVVLGTLLGLALGHLGLYFLQKALENAQQIELGSLYFLQEEIWILLLAPVLGLLAALIPALSAYNLDISKILAKE